MLLPPLSVTLVFHLFLWKTVLCDLRRGCHPPNTEKLSAGPWRGDRQLDLVSVDGDLGIEGTLVVQVSVHLNSGCHKVRNVHSHLGNEFQAD